MDTVIVIPARLGSTRLPGKPLALIKEKSLIYRTWSIAQAVQRVDQVIIATDDVGIQRHAQAFGATVFMTPQSCVNGTERVWAAIRLLKQQPAIILNLQGDAVLTPPQVIQALIDHMQQNPTVGFATLATPITVAHYQQMQTAKNNGVVGGTTVVFDHTGNALYFSKRMIPFVRENKADAPLYQHIGLYAYRYAVLQQYLALPPSPLEITEGLEQLRALENGIKIKVVQVDYQGRTSWSVDSPEDIAIVENIIAQEGELVL